MINRCLCKNMEDVMLTLTADGQSFLVRRDVLTKESLYFYAALESGMSESKTSHFIFPNLSAHQLSMVARFSRSGFAVWNDDFQMDLCDVENEDTTSCSENIKLIETLELADAADYFQMPTLIKSCMNRLVFILNKVFRPETIYKHELHKCDIFSTCLLEFVKFVLYDNISMKKLLHDFVIYYSYFIFKPCNLEPDIGPYLISLVVSYLSDNSICVPNESYILNIIIEWLNSLKSRQFHHELIIRALIQCVRPGLLWRKDQERLLEYWHTNYSQFKWFGELTYTCMKNLLENYPYGSMFSYCCSHYSPITRMLLAPRVDSVCLLGLAPSRSTRLLEFWFFNLHNGAYHNFPIPFSCFCELNTSGSYESDSRIYFCPLSGCTDVNQSTVFVLCFHPDDGAIRGFAWCLASCQAKSVPCLFLHNSDQKQLNNTIPTVFRSRRIGLSTLSTGVHVYYVTSLPKVTMLYVFRFDVKHWCWVELEPHALIQNQEGITLFTPIDLLNSPPPDDWLYVNIEVASCCCSHGFRHQRHGLHQTSAIRSHFFRFRPHFNGKCVEVQDLPSPPFLLRIYRLLSIVDSKGQDLSRRTLLFPMGTCSRDHEAVHYYFDSQSHQWLRWSPCEYSDEQSDNPSDSKNTDNPDLKINLCSEILGFRGFVCTTNLTSYLDETKSVFNPFFLVNDIQEACLYGSKSKEQPDDLSVCFLNEKQTVKNVNSSMDSNPPTKTILVLAGRPNRNMNVSSGIWFHCVQPCQSESVGLFDCQKPKYLLPAAVSQTLSLYSTSTVVVLANWMHIVRSSEPVNFIRQQTGKEIHSNYSDEPVLTSDLNSQINFSCSCDSD